MTTKNLNLVGFLILILSGCNSVYFTEPQPVNTKNLFEFPSKYHGVWMEGEDTITINKNIYKSVSYRNESIEKSIIDTSSVHLLANGKIYFIKIDDKIKLTGGFPYVLKNDTIFYKYKDVVEVFLGGNTFLRKVADKHILNIKSDELWWELVLVEKSKDGSLYGRRLSKDDMANFQDEKPIWEGDGMMYYDIKWREHE